MTSRSESGEPTGSTPSTGGEGACRAPRNAILRVVLAYAIFASLWILASDMIIGWLISDPGIVTLASTIKGWVFVAVTSLLLYGLLRGLAGTSSADETRPAQGSLFPPASRYEGPIFLLLAAMLIVVTAGAIIHNLLEQGSADGAKTQRTEIRAAADANVWIGLTGLLALFVAGAGVYLARQRQQLAVNVSIQQAQAERLRALNLLAAIADGSEDAIFAKDREGRYLLFNRAASRFVGLPVAAVLGRDDHALFPNEQAEMLLAANRRVIEEERARSQEEVLDTALGRRVFLATKGPLRDAEGRIIGTFGVSRDITERKAAEDALASQAAELAERNRELERFNEAMVGRELDMIALKRQINALSAQLGREPPFVLETLDAVEQTASDGHP